MDTLNRVEIKKAVFVAISVIVFWGLILIIPMDYFCHGFYCEDAGYENINQEDYLGCIDLGEGTFE